MAEFLEFINSSGFMNLGWQNLIMVLIGIIFIILSISRNLEPYELLPIGLGILVVNLMTINFNKRRNMTPVVTYLRTSSNQNVGVDKDSDTIVAFTLPKMSFKMN